MTLFNSKNSVLFIESLKGLFQHVWYYLKDLLWYNILFRVIENMSSFLIGGVLS